MAYNGRVYLTFAAERSESEPGLPDSPVSENLRRARVPQMCPKRRCGTRPSFSPARRVSARGKK